MKLSLLILTYNRVELSSKYIPLFVEKAGDIEYEILIWDNGSTDGSYDWALEYGNACHKVTKVFGSPTNLGMEAFNYLAEEAKGEYILKLDDDIDVPNNFAQRLTAAYEQLAEPKLIFLGWDMAWHSKNHASNTFATRSGFGMYQGDRGKVVYTNKRTSEAALITYNPQIWMMNGVCRLGPRKQFLEIGGHPKGIIYGVDRHISRIAHEHGYWIGYLTSNELVYHRGSHDEVAYRQFKNRELHRTTQAGP